MLDENKLKRLTTKRLLAYLKSQRKILFRFRYGWDDWARDMPLDFDSEEQTLQAQYDLTKKVLATRENI